MAWCAPVTKPSADADSEGNDNSAAASGGGFDDGFKHKVLNYIHANQKGKRKRGDGKTTKPEFFFQGDLAAQTKTFEARYDADDLKKRKALILGFSPAREPATVAA